MDVVFSDVLQDLNNFQSKIASLFEDFMKEKVYYSNNLDHLCKNLKESSTEIENLKKEIEVLREDNLNMKEIIYRGINLFKNLDLSRTSKQNTNELEELKTIFLEYSKKINNSNLTDTEKKGEVGIKRFELTEEDIEKEIKLLRGINFCTNLFDDVDDNITENNSKEDCSLQRSCSDKTYESSGDLKENELVPRTKSCQLDFISSTIDTGFDKPVEVLSENNKSPVFKDFSGRRHSNLSVVEENGFWESEGSILINEEFLKKNCDLDLSSPEKSCQDAGSNSKSPAEKWVNKSMKIPPRKIPPSNVLKKSNSRVVEKTRSGPKILTQTLINVERTKRKGPEKSKSRHGEENENRSRPGLDETMVGERRTSDEEIDDTIIEIPDKADRVSKDVKSRKTSRSELEEINVTKPPVLTEHDLDETYISSSMVQKHMLDREGQTPLKRHALERPERDIPYKDKPVRKKAERMKLPGHACLECNKYYENALGDVGTQELKKILNKCSRHRDRFSPSFDYTPPDYWKPYLTCSTVVSPNS